MLAILNLLIRILDIYYFILIATAILSWLIAFNVINLHNDAVRSIWKALNALTEPVLAQVRRLVPSIGNIDISFIIVILAILFLEDFIRSSISPLIR